MYRRTNSRLPAFYCAITIAADLCEKAAHQACTSHLAPLVFADDAHGVLLLAHKCTPLVQQAKAVLQQQLPRLNSNPRLFAHGRVIKCKQVSQCKYCCTHGADASAHDSKCKSTRTHQDMFACRLLAQVERKAVEFVEHVRHHALREQARRVTQVSVRVRTSAQGLQPVYQTARAPPTLSEGEMPSAEPPSCSCTCKGGR